MDDGDGENDEFFEIGLSNISGANIGSSSLLRVNIIDGTGTNAAPNAVAGAGQTVASGTTVTLNGSGSNDPDGNNLTFAWSQTLGPNVVLNNPGTDTATFQAPTVNSDTLFRFELLVTDSGGLTDTSVASVTVTGNGNSGIGGGGGGGAMSLWMLLGILLGMQRSLAISRRGESSQ